MKEGCDYIMSNNSNENLNNLINQASKHLGVDPSKLKESAKSGNVSDVLKNLDPKDAKKIQNVVSDKNAANKLLSTPQAKALLKKILGGE